MRRKVQVVLVELPGAEPWVLVQHQHGSFKVPQSVAVSELLEGALARWGTRHPTPREGRTWVRVPVQTYLAMSEAARRAGYHPD